MSPSSARNQRPAQLNSGTFKCHLSCHGNVPTGACPHASQKQAGGLACCAETAAQGQEKGQIAQRYQVPLTHDSSRVARPTGHQDACKKRPGTKAGTSIVILRLSYQPHFSLPVHMH